jgi:hypothetical protein
VAVLGRRCAMTVVAARRSRSYTVLQALVFGKIFTYGIRATRGTCLANLWVAVGDDGG